MKSIGNIRNMEFHPVLGIFKFNSQNTRKVPLFLRYFVIKEFIHESYVCLCESM